MGHSCGNCCCPENYGGECYSGGCEANPRVLTCAHCGNEFKATEGYGEHGYDDVDFCSERCFEAWLENQSLEGLDEEEEGAPSFDGSGK